MEYLRKPCICSPPLSWKCHPCGRPETLSHTLEILLLPLYFWVGQINGMLGLNMDSMVSSKHDLDPSLLTWSPFIVLTVLPSAWLGVLLSFTWFISLTPSSHPTILWCLFQNCVPCSHCPDSGSIFLCQKIVTRRAASLPLWSPLLLCLWSYFPGSSDIFFFLWLSSLHVCLLSRQLYPF